jgi:hypothetical protein
MLFLKAVGIGSAIGVALAFSLSYLLPGINGVITAGVGSGVTTYLIMAKLLKS